MVKPTSVPLGAARGADEWAGAGTHYVGGTFDGRVAQSMQLLEARDFSALLASTFADRDVRLADLGPSSPCIEIRQ
jgi:hypothetical protein